MLIGVLSNIHSNYYALKSVLNKAKKIILNPGSVGQPRDNKPGASWVLLDTRIKKIVFMRENYNVQKIKKECKKYDPHLPFLSSYFWQWIS